MRLPRAPPPPSLLMRSALIMGGIDDLQTRVQAIEKANRTKHRASEVSLRLQTIPESA